MLAGCLQPAVYHGAPYWVALQALGDARAAEYMRGRRIMEINPDHPIIQALKVRPWLG